MIDEQADRPWRTETFWAGTRQPLGRSTGLDPRAYTDPSYWADERDLLFGRAWVAVGLAAEVARPGPVLVRPVGPRSILVTRETGGGLRGFLNACRHRGTELVEDDGDLPDGVLRCPYHRWTYRLDGSLRAAPRFDELPLDDFDPADHALIPVRVDTWGPLLLACLDDHTPPLDRWLGDLAERMAGYGLDRWTVAEERTVGIDANWKLVSENYQEYYHLPWVHPELAKVSRVRDHYRYQGPGMYCGQTTTPVSSDDRDDWLVLPPADGLDSSDAVSGRFVAVFPNALVSVLPNHALVMRLESTGPGHTREHLSFLLPPSTPRPGRDGEADDPLAPTRRFWFEVNDEDIDIVERGQRGLTTGAVPPGPLSPRFEEPLHRFHTMVADLMTRASLADLPIPGGDDRSEAARRGTGPNPDPPAIDAVPPTIDAVPAAIPDTGPDGRPDDHARSQR